jgi:putative oxidoreductase
MKRFTSIKPLHSNAGMLLLRVFAGTTMLLSHGWGKLLRLLDGDTGFVDVMGIGELPSLLLTIFAEVFCALLVTLGLWTRFAALPLIITMAVAVFYVHAGDPFSKQELGLFYLVAYSTIFLLGPGKYSFDAQMKSS